MRPALLLSVLRLGGAGGFVATIALFWWLGSRAEKAEAESLKKILAAKVEPKIEEAWRAKTADAERMTAQTPEYKVYANNTVDFDYQWDELGIGGTPTREHVYDARFVSLEIGHKQKDASDRIRHNKRTSLLGSDTYHDATRRQRWSVEVDFGETDRQRRYRAHLKTAGELARRGVSARQATESQHFDRGPHRSPSRKDMDRMKLGQPTEADMLEADDRELFVNAYIEYVAFRGPDDQYLPAVAYLHELEAARNAPWQPSPRLKKLEPLGPFTGVPAGTR